MSAIAVLFSETTRARRAAEAVGGGAIYPCRSSRARIDWVVGPRAYLAPYGALSALRRLGLRSDLVSEGDVRAGALGRYRGLVAADAAFLDPDVAGLVTSWLRAPGCSLIASGPCPGLDDILGVRRVGRVALAGVVGVDTGASRIAVAGPGTEVEHVEARDGAKTVGPIWEMRPWPAGAGPADRAAALSAAVLTERTLYLTVPLFEHLGGALQGHVDIEALRGLSGFAGLENAVRWLGRLMDDALPARPWSVRLPPWGRHPAALVVRHDTDHSRDDTYLEYEIKETVPATYAVLPDANRRYWLERLASLSHIEAAFHYRTNVESRLGKFLRRARGYVPDRRAVSGRGLARQVAAARRLGIPVNTLHRHASFFFYPESIVGLDALVREAPDVVGASSIFRWTLYRYGEGAFSQAVTVLHPDTSVPFWMPFRPVVTAVEGHRVVPSWESTHLIEPDPPLLARLFADADAAPGGAYIVGYHPAHATAPTFTPGGNFPWFERCIHEARARGWWLATCRDLYLRLSDWERLTLTIDDRGARVANSSPRPFRDLVLTTPAGASALGDVAPGGEATLAW